jgi:hypothetical protein
MMLLGLSAIMMSSLFFSSQECRDIENLEHSNMAQNPAEKEDMPLVLNGILCRPDLNHWIVWINGIRIYSQRPQSIQGWTIVKVHSDSVIVRSKDGEERELRPEQDSDLDEFNTSMDENTPEDLDINEGDQNTISGENDQNDISSEESADSGENDQNDISGEESADSGEESAGTPETENSAVIPEASKNFESNLISHPLRSQEPKPSL